MHDDEPFHGQTEHIQPAVTKGFEGKRPFMTGYKAERSLDRAVQALDILATAEGAPEQTVHAETDVQEVPGAPGLPASGSVPPMDGSASAFRDPFSDDEAPQSDSEPTPDPSDGEPTQMEDTASSEVGNDVLFGEDLPPETSTSSVEAADEPPLADGVPERETETPDRPEPSPGEAIFSSTVDDADDEAVGFFDPSIMDEFDGPTADLEDQGEIEAGSEGPALGWGQSDTPAEAEPLAEEPLAPGPEEPDDDGFFDPSALPEDIRPTDEPDDSFIGSPDLSDEDAFEFDDVDDDPEEGPLGSTLEAGFGQGYDDLSEEDEGARASDDDDSPIGEEPRGSAGAGSAGGARRRISRSLVQAFLLVILVIGVGAYLLYGDGRTLIASIFGDGPEQTERMPVTATADRAAQPVTSGPPRTDRAPPEDIKAAADEPVIRTSEAGQSRSGPWQSTPEAVSTTADAPPVSEQSAPPPQASRPEPRRVDGLAATGLQIPTPEFLGEGRSPAQSRAVRHDVPATPAPARSPVAGATDSRPSPEHPPLQTSASTGSDAGPSLPAKAAPSGQPASQQDGFPARFELLEGVAQSRGAEPASPDEARATLEQAERRIAELEAQLRDLTKRVETAELRATRANARADGVAAVLPEVAALQSTVEVLGGEVVALLSDVARIDSYDPASTVEDVASDILSRVESRIDNLTADVGIIARMAANNAGGIPALRHPDTGLPVGAPAASTGTQSVRDILASTPVPQQRPEPHVARASRPARVTQEPIRSERKPFHIQSDANNRYRTVKVGDFVAEYGEVLAIRTAQGGGKLVIMENGSVFVP
ncbi:hypothetical protein [Amorphus sp. 3PC139-8]|uniref:hypothetical protein n=1 Tax=Amorphus sp. 3PC139-8 TaxID=2735676 RepID=UPI00345DD84E